MVNLCQLLLGRALNTYLLLGTFLTLSYSMMIQTSHLPVALNLKTYKQMLSENKNTTDLLKRDDVRTKPFLFQKVLGLKPGKIFEFPMDRWRALKESGLYYNLTVQTIIKNNEAYLNISGVERPCVTFAPELSVGSSLSNPNVAGGILYRNKNFRGLGEQFELMLAKKERLELAQQDVQDLGISAKLKWRDCSIGEASNIELKCEKDSLVDINRNFDGGLLDKLEKVIVGITKVCAVTKSSFKAPFSDMLHQVELEQYISHIDQQRDKSFIMSGTKGRYDIENTKNKFGGSLWFDTGNCVDSSIGLESGLRAFNVLGYSFSSPTLSILSKYSSFLKMKIQGFGFKAMGSGATPYFHFQSIANPNLIRCAKIDRSDAHNSISEAFSAKVDIYMKHATNLIVPGIFVDFCCYEEQTKEKDFAASCGLSLRSRGIRIDVGIPIISPDKPRFHIGLDQVD